MIAYSTALCSLECVACSLLIRAWMQLGQWVAAAFPLFGAEPAIPAAPRWICCTCSASLNLLHFQRIAESAALAANHWICCTLQQLAGPGAPLVTFLDSLYLQRLAESAALVATHWTSCTCSESLDQLHSRSDSVKGAQAWDIRSLGFSWFLHHKVSTGGRLWG